MRHDSDVLAKQLLGVFAAATALLLALVLGFLIRESVSVISVAHVWHFLTDDGWYPLERRFGLLPMAWATLVVSLGALLVAAPLALALAAYETFLASPVVASILRLGMGLLAGIPSVVYGLWGLTVVVPLIAGWQAPGTSLLAAILVLALMIVPTIAITSSAALARVPLPWLQGAAALGMSHRTLLLGIAFPAARGGIVAGIVLAAARALGETMAVLMVAGNVVQTPSSLFDSVRVLTANIALEMAYAEGDHRAALFASGLALALLVLALTALAHRAQRGGSYAA